MEKIEVRKDHCRPDTLKVYNNNSINLDGSSELLGIIKEKAKCARPDLSEQVHFISIKHTPYVTRVHCRDIIHADQYERAQFMCFIKEIKKLVPRAL